MVSRLPIPGHDDDAWGSILNDFLTQAHNADGSIAPITLSQVTGLNAVLSSKANTTSLATVATTGSYNDLADKPAGTATDASAGTKGILKLTGDLGGTADSPTVPGLTGKEPTLAAGSSTQYYRGDKSWQTLNQDAVPDGTTNKAYTATEKTKLAAMSGTNTGDQTSVTGNAGTATKLATPRNINGTAFDGSADITLPDVVIITANAQTASYTLVLSDAGRSIDMTSASATTITVPPSSSVAWATGTVVEGAQLGTGTVTLTAGAGVTIRSASTLVTRTQYSTWGLRYLGSNVWLVSGDLT